MKLFYSLLLLICTSNTSFSQESLLLGELKRDEIKPEMVNPGIKKITVHKRKIRGLFGKKDSSTQSILDYSKEGLLLERLSFFGKKGNSYVQEYYDYNESGKVINYQERVKSEGELTTKVAIFEYNRQDQLINQITSLATIAYDYFKDGRLKTKSYYYNSGDPSLSEPWTHYFLYDNNQQLIHVDTDSSSEEQTSFYNDHGDLIRHDYYPGYAYSLYYYDNKGNCTRQTDYEKLDNDWDSTVFVFEYDKQDRLIMTSSTNKRGKMRKDKKLVYDEDGKIDYIIKYKRNKAKWRLNYVYESY